MTAGLRPRGPIPAGETSDAISRRMIGLHRELYGKGPSRAKTYYYDDFVTVLMRGGFTAVEETLFRSGRSGAVTEQRSEFQRAMEKRFIDVVAEETGREVVAFMSTSHQHPDLVAELFLLAPTDMADDHPGPTDATGPDAADRPA